MADLPTVALIPAAGAARRLGRLPCSKEVLPIGLEQGDSGALVPRLAIHDLLRRLAAAGVERGYVVLPAAKWDVARYLGRGDDWGLPLAYVVTEPTPSLPATLDRAYPFAREARVVLGFPDVLFEPADAYTRILGHQSQTGADVVLGLFPAPAPHTTDMVELDAGGRVRRIEVRPAVTELELNWLLAVWTPRFTELVHEVLHHRAMAEHPPESSGELQLGSLLGRALEAGLDVRGVPFRSGRYHDLGTPETLAATLLAGGTLPPAGGSAGPA